MIRPPRKNPTADSTPLVRRWKTALSNAGLSQSEWATRDGWTESHVSQVVAGKRQSPAVMREVLLFIATQEREIAERVPRGTRPTAA